MARAPHDWLPVMMHHNMIYALMEPPNVQHILCEAWAQIRHDGWVAFLSGHLGCEQIVQVAET